MRFGFFCFLITMVVPAVAAEPVVQKRYTRDYAICMENGPASEGVQPAMNACAYEEYTRQDARLNQAYVMTMRRQAAVGKTKLRGSQRAWIKERDVKCAAERGEYEGGSIAPLIFHSCMTDETIRRTLWLERYR
jgi:uncharacterized protein YecT (DUF1311 family)